MGERTDDGDSRPAGGGSRRLITRRQLLKAGVAAGAAGAVGSRLGSGLSTSQGRLIERLTNLVSSSFDPAQVKHVVVLMQENRSFDHYFGTLTGVHGFSDPFANRYPGNVAGVDVFKQVGPLSALPGWTGPTTGGQAVLEPWQLVSCPPFKNGQATNDITHDWTPQHQAFDHGKMDKWFSVHAANDKNNITTPLSTATSNDGYMTMGYLTAPDVAFYHALAEAFTICDGYFCSVLGPTDPNRLMLMSNSVGIDKPGGPLLTTLVQTRPQEFGQLGWRTQPEAWQAAGLSWKVYGDPTAHALFNVLPYFKQYQSDATLALNAFGSVYPVNFAADVVAGTLPQVSYILPPANACEHPAAPPGDGEDLVHQILTILTANQAVWESTVFFVVYDENGGWFDHVPPPTPNPAQISTWASQGEWLGSDDGVTNTPVGGAGGGSYLNGPVGLGFRTPCLVISPFSRGGYLCSPYYEDTGGVHIDPAGTFDSTSLNRFITKVFTAQGHSIEPPPNLSAWRQSVTGDFTTAFAGVDDTSVPTLPVTSSADPYVTIQGVINGAAGTAGYAPQPYPPPTRNGTFPPKDDQTTFKPTLH
jgi:phospholipase C